MNIGCDIVKNSRLQNKSTNFINKVLTKNEIELYKKFGVEFLAGRFAAKEAIIKCFKEKKLNFTDIEILSDNHGAPTCNIENVLISISHEKEYTIAYAIKTK